MNPGPSRNLYFQQAQQDYALIPKYFYRIFAFFDLPLPSIDAFASPENCRVPKFWSIFDDAFLHNWSSEKLIWANPPFHLLNRVLDRLKNQPVHIVLLFPVIYPYPLAFLFKISTQHLLLPNEPIFIFSNRRILPTPPWPIYVFHINTKHTFWNIRKLLLLSGDIEQNPGPAIVPFQEFCTSFANEFLQSISSIEMSRKKIELKFRSQTWPPSWWQTLLVGTSFQLSVDDALPLFVAYEVYADVILQFQDDHFLWSPNSAVSASQNSALLEQISMLQKEIAELKVQKMTINTSSEEYLSQNFSLESVLTFQKFEHLPVWMREMSKIFQSSFEDIQEDGAKSDPLQELWKLMVHTFFRYKTSFKTTNSFSSEFLRSSSPFHSFSPSSHVSSSFPSSQSPSNSFLQSSSSSVQRIHPPVNFGVDELIRRGGKVYEEHTPHGLQNFAILGEDKFYISRDGSLWNVKFPPPKKCFRCSRYHWHWECEIQNSK